MSFRVTGSRPVAEEADGHAVAIRECLEKFHAIYRAEDILRVRIQEAETALRAVMSRDDAENLGKLDRRLTRIQELRRSMEIGSLTVEAKRALDESWGSMP